MTLYETLFISHPDLSAEDCALLTERVKDVITSKGGEVQETEEWGKRKLAYEINKVRDGNFTLIKFLGNNDILDELNHIFKITESVLRGLIVKLEK